MATVNLEDEQALATLKADDQQGEGRQGDRENTRG